MDNRKARYQQIHHDRCQYDTGPQMVGEGTLLNVYLWISSMGATTGAREPLRLATQPNENVVKALREKTSVEGKQMHVFGHIFFSSLFEVLDLGKIVDHRNREHRY